MLNKPTVFLKRVSTGELILGEEYRVATVFEVEKAINTLGISRSGKTSVAPGQRYGDTAASRFVRWCNDNGIEVEITAESGVGRLHPVQVY